MLAHLYIKNYAIIDSLDVDWVTGMTAITGETGAGKSIMIGALQFVLGARADSKILRNPDEKCIVEVKFNHIEYKKSELENFEFLDQYEEIIIRREILPNGRSRSFINDSPVTVTELNELSPLLISIHQQFDHLDILDEKFQLEMLDIYIGQVKQTKEYQSLYRNYKKLIQEKKLLEEDQRKSNEEKDYVEFQLSELVQSNLIAQEYQNLEENLAIAVRAEEIIKNITAATELVDNDNGILDQFQEINNLLKGLNVIPAIEEIYLRFQGMKTECKDILSNLQKIVDKTEFDPEKINTLQSRFDLLTRLLKKHRVQSDLELIAIRDTLSTKVKGFSNLDQQIKNKENEIVDLQNELYNLANILSNKRSEQSINLEPHVVRLLKLLGMEFAQFRILVNKQADINENGVDRIEFLFSANKGSEPKPIKNQASGGELSRLNLVLKSLISNKAKLPTMIFDEIDTGVSGQIALQMGNILRDMSKELQLITITHSPQVASRASHHYYVFKDSSSKITNTRFKKLEKQERMIELAKMLSGDPPSESAIQNANELITSAN
ncbi:MAG: DNA repair protein RecN [Saprospiraceae bacterium]